MFPCVKCTKPTTDDQDEGKAKRHGNVSSKPKQATRSITRQLKGIVLKFTGINKQRKPSSGSVSYQKRHHEDSGAVSDDNAPPFPYVEGGSSGSGAVSDDNAPPFPYVEGGSSGSGAVSDDNAPPFPYVEGGSSGSTPKWEFTTFNHQIATANEGSTNTAFPMPFVGIPVIARSEYYSATSSDHVVVNEGGSDQTHEWIGELEEGITVIFASLPTGGHEIRKIHFSQEMFDKDLAQTWWYHNYHRLKETYNVVSLNGQAIYTPDDVFGERTKTMLIFEGEGSTSQSAPSLNQSFGALDLKAGGGGGHNFNIAAAGSSSGIIAPPTSLVTTPGSSQRNTNRSLEAEWVEEDEPGVFLTIRQSADGVREIIRLRFSRKKFDVDGAKNWFVDNKERIEAQYL